MPTILHASVSPNILAKADRLFTNRLKDVLIEIFQNARRAGATRIQVDTTAVPNSTKTQITVLDNGSGIEDFSTLLCLGNSEWDPDVAAREDPAGMGFFSLLHSGVEVTSRGHQAAFSKENFLGLGPVEVTDVHTPFVGTRLVFQREEQAASISEEVRNVAQYCKTECVCNGVLVKQVDFLQNALYVREVDGVRIGVSQYISHLNYPTWNFHGRLITLNTHSLKNCIVFEGSLRTLEVRFDVQDTRAIRLQLPDRSSVVQDELYTALMQEAKVAMYTCLATLPSHCASFELYEEAHSLGVQLKEASPWFRVHCAREADNDNSNDFLSTDSSYVLADEATSAIVAGDPAETDVADFTFSTASAYLAELPVQPLEAEDLRYGGYSWYSAFPRLHSFALKIDGIEASTYSADGMLTVVDKIELSFSASNRRDPLVWDLPFTGLCDDEQWGEDGLRFFITRNSPWFKGEHEPFDLVEAAVYIAYVTSDDSDSDSYETQIEGFRSSVRREFLQVTGGQRLVLTRELAEALGSWSISDLLRKESISDIHISRSPDGQMEINLTPAA